MSFKVLTQLGNWINPVSNVNILKSDWVQYTLGLVILNYLFQIPFFLCLCVASFYFLLCSLFVCLCFLSLDWSRQLNWFHRFLPMYKSLLKYCINISFKKEHWVCFFMYKNLHWGKKQQTEKPLTKNVTINIVSCCTHEGICYLKPRNKRGMQLFEGTQYASQSGW